MLLHQCHHALIEFVQVGPAQEHTGQGREAQTGDQSRAMALVAQAAVQAQADEHRQSARNDAGIQPEAFG
ncbi:hypothetical protein D3C76_1582000 [compost metagenome]